MPSGREVTAFCRPTDTMQTLLNIASEETMVAEYFYEAVYQGFLCPRESLIESHNIPNGATISILSSKPEG